MSKPEPNVHLNKRESSLLEVALTAWAATHDFPPSMLPEVDALRKKVERHAVALYFEDWWTAQVNAS